MSAVMNCFVTFQGLMHSYWIPNIEEKEEAEETPADL
jgi:hypothetical protein